MVILRTVVPHILKRKFFHKDAKLTIIKPKMKKILDSITVLFSKTRVASRSFCSFVSILQMI
jgi:hypothetical protein